MKTDFSAKDVLNTRSNRQSELLNDIQRAHLIGAWEWESDSDHYFWSDSMFYLHDLVPSPDNLISRRDAQNMIHPKDISLVLHHWEELQKSGHADFRFSIALPDGKIKQIHAQGKAVLNNNGHFFRGSYQEESRELLQPLYDEIKKQQIQLTILDKAEQIAQTGTWQVNLATFATFYSDNIFRLYGLLPGSVTSHPDSFLRFIHAEDKNTVVNAFEKSYNERIPIHLEYRIIRQDDETRYVKQVSSIINNEKGEQVLTGTMHDITEKKWLELSLQHSYDNTKLQQDLFHQVEHIGMIGTMQVNLHTRKVYYSDNMCALYGLKPQSVLHTAETFFPYIHPEDRTTIVEGATRMFEGFILPPIEYRITRHDGKARILKQITRRITSASGEELLTAVVQDITEQNAFKMQLKDVTEQLIIQNESYGLAEKIISIGSWFRNLNTGKTIYSDNIYNIHGLKPGTVALEIEFFSKFIHPADKKLFSDIIEKIRNEVPHVDGEYRIIRPDGDTRYLRSRNKMITSPAGEKIVIGTLQDVTPEVLLSQELTDRIDFTEMLSDTILDSIIVTDTANNIIACNKQCEKIHLVKKEEVLRKNIFDVFPQLKNPEMIENFRKALGGKTVRIPAARSVLTRGYNDLLMQPLKNKNDQILGVLLLLHDVTQQYQLQQALKERLGFIEKLVESSIDRVMVLDNNLNYIIWNRNCENYYGIKKEEIIGKNVLELFPMFKVEPIYQDCKKALSGENIYIPATKNQDNEYSESYLVPLKNDKGEVTSILWIIHDLTEIMLARERLVTSETHLKNAQEIAHLGSWEYEHGSGKITWSDEVFRIYGYEPASFEPTIEFYLNTSHHDRQPEIKKLLEIPGQAHSFINMIYTVDGRVRHIQTMGHPISDGSGKNVKIIGTVQDITEQKILQDQLLEKTRLIRSQYQVARQEEMMRNIGTWQWNPESGNLFWSENMFRMLGYTPHSFDPTFEKFMSFVHSEDKQIIAGALEDIKSMQSGTLPVLEYRMTDIAGKIKYVRSTCRVVNNQKGKFITGTALDVTADVMVKQELSWYNKLLQTVVGSCTDAISIFDHNLRCIAWNERSEKLYGKSRADTRGLNLYDIFPEINNEPNISYIARTVQQGDEELTIEIANTHVSFIPVIHSEKEKTGLLLVTRD